ncbi:conserved hypothetical protein [Theileria orientalis strain Shintoku]|uniref:Uncharacterized protein n=1 Tax=Theileria orientalis strain Shintoku TaxID=869250 RepID=J4CCW3_THEOR|nr:conserved hypothetical protein [Theileria orientalis strain Shintoku]BAM40092.1 conserved hypothetical protein [Theileria orientalis strain Shintoku]|eukprot:XP_009690393.1 conserved hypothetical protein [Theileria orientalis strain Shintoku]
MHLLRRDYIFFYNEGIVCYKATPVSPKKVVKRSINFKNEKTNVSPKIEKYKTNNISDPQITLVPPKPLNLFESLQEEKEEVPEEKKVNSKPKIRPQIVLNTLYSLVYPFTETGNTYVFPKKEEAEIKHENKKDDKQASNKTVKPSYKFRSDVNCYKCSDLNRLDKEDYIYTCPETISPHRTTDLLVNKHVIRKKRFIDDHYDLDQQHTSKAEVDRGIPLTYKIVREKTFIDDTVQRKRSYDRANVLDDYELTGYEDEIVELEPEPYNRDIVIKTRLDRIKSENNPTIVSIIKSLDNDPVFIDRLANYQKDDIERILSNEEISQVIESPNVLSSPESFSRQLSKFPSVKTVSGDSKTLENEAVSQHSTVAFDDPLEQKSSQNSNVPTTKSDDGASLVAKDSTQPPSSDVKSGDRSDHKVPFYPMPFAIRPILFPRKKQPLPLKLRIKEPINTSAVKSEETAGDPIKASDESPTDSGPNDTIASDENLTTSNVASESPEITDYQTSEPSSKEQDAIDTRKEDEVNESVEEPIEVEPVKPVKKLIPIKKPIVIEPVELPIEAEPAEPIEPPESVEEQTDTKPVEEVEAEPTEPVEEVKPVEPTEPVEEVKPVEPTEPVEEVKPTEIKPVEQVEEVKPVEEAKNETAIVPKAPGEVYINAKNKEVIRPLKNTKNNVLIKGFEATVFAVNSNKTATSALCTVMFNYNNDLLIIKSQNDVFEIKATDLTSEEIPTSPGSPILLKICLNNRASSAIVLQTYARKNLEILAGTIGWVKNSKSTKIHCIQSHQTLYYDISGDKEEFGDKAPRMNVRRSLFAGLKGNKRKERLSNGNGVNDNSAQGTGKTENTWLYKEEEKERSKKLFNRMKRRQKDRDVAKYY